MQCSLPAPVDLVTCAIGPRLRCWLMAEDRHSTKRRVDGGGAFCRNAGSTVSSLPLIARATLTIASFRVGVRLGVEGAMWTVPSSWTLIVVSCR
jgi:hypothetical protein